MKTIILFGRICTVPFIIDLSNINLEKRREYSKKIQEEIFKRGIFWADGSTTPLYLDNYLYPKCTPYLIVSYFFEVGKVELTFLPNEAEDLRAYSEYSKYTVTDLFKKDISKTKSNPFVNIFKGEN